MVPTYPNMPISNIHFVFLLVTYVTDVTDVFISQSCFSWHSSWGCILPMEPGSKGMQRSTLPMEMIHDRMILLEYFI